MTKERTSGGHQPACHHERRMRRDLPQARRTRRSQDERDRGGNEVHDDEVLGAQAVLDVVHN